MKICYVDEIGTDGKSPLLVMAGIVADTQRLRRTQADFLTAFSKMGELSPKTLRELKAVDLYRGNGAWRGVDGESRHQMISDLCDWLCERKHQIAGSHHAFPFLTMGCCPHGRAVGSASRVVSVDQ